VLTDTEIKKLKATGKEYQRADGKGLVIVIRAKGEKFWRYEYRIDNKKLKFGYGNYPQISLSDARKIHEVARQLVAFNKHPASLLDSPNAIQMIIDGCSIKEIEAQAVVIEEAEAIIALATFGDAAEKYKTDWVNVKKGVAIFAKDFSGLPARKISKKSRDRQCLRLPRFVYGHLPFCKQFRPSGFRLRLHTYIRPQS